MDFLVRGGSRQPSTSLLRNPADDTVVIYEGELFQQDMFNFFRRGWWKLCWTNARQEEGVLLRFNGPGDDTPLTGARNNIYLRTVTTLCPMEQSEVEASTSSKRPSITLGSGQTLWRIGLETTTGTTLMLASPSPGGRDAWLEVMYDTLVKTVVNGHHQDAGILAEIQALQQSQADRRRLAVERMQRERAERERVQRDQAVAAAEEEKSPTAAPAPPSGSADLLDLDGF